MCFVLFAAVDERHCFFFCFFALFIHVFFAAVHVIVVIILFTKSFFVVFESIRLRKAWEISPVLPV